MAQDLIKPVLEDYLDSALDALTTSVNRVVRAPGTSPAFDDCCEGQLYTRVDGITPHTNGRIRPASGPGCGVVGWIVDIGIGVVRCAATVNNNGEPPNARQVSADGDQMSQDMSDLAAMLRCHERTYEVSEWTALENQGGCHGGEWRFTARVDVAPCDEED